MKRQLKQEIDQKMGRKFRYLRLLQKPINSFKKYIQMKNETKEN